MNKEKLPIEWSREDLYNMALRIKEHPEDMKLKEIFLNLIPDTGEYFNIQLYMTLKDCYYIYSGKYFHCCTLDDFMEMNLFHIYQRSFADWNPDYSLATYFRLLTRPNGIIGRIIMKEVKRISILDSFADLERYEADNPDAADASISYSMTLNEDREENLIKEILPVLGISEEELRILLILDGRDFHTKGMADIINGELGTAYTLEELKVLRIKTRRKIKSRMDVIRKFFDTL